MVSALGQDSTQVEKEKPFRTYQFTETQFLQGEKGQFVDTTLNHFYHNSNIFTGYRANLGNIGTASRSLMYQGSHGTGIRMGIDAFKDVQISPSQLLFARTNQPYSRVKYILGSKAEQNLSIEHTQNVTKRLNVGVNARLINSEGFYARLKTRTISVGAHSNYRSKNERYGLLFRYTFNNTVNQENGGITSDTSFVDNDISRNLIAVFLNNAQNRNRNHQFEATQYWQFGHYKSEVKPGDTVETKTFVPGSRLLLKSSYREETFAYRDDSPDSTYYSNLIDYRSVIDYDDTLAFSSQFPSLNDSLKYIYWNVGLEWNDASEAQDNLHGFRKLVVSRIWGRYEHFDHYQFFNHARRDNILIGAGVNSRQQEKFGFGLSGVFNPIGHNEGDFRFGADLFLAGNDWMVDSVKQGSVWKVHLFGEAKGDRAAWVEDSYQTPYFAWERNLDQVRHYSVGGRLELKPFDLYAEGRIVGVENYIYFDQTAMPVQKDGFVQYSALRLGKAFKWKRWHWNSDLVLQQSGNNDVLRVPGILSLNQFYFQYPFRGTPLLLRVGAEVYYFSQFKADSYMPITRQFHLQDADEVGNYPMVDFLVSAQIKKARIFFKTVHVNQGFSGNSFLLTPAYPLQDRMFRFGIDWIFLN